MNATINNNPIVDSGTGYIKYYDGTMICTGSEDSGEITWTQDGTSWVARNLTLSDFAEEFVSTPLVIKTIESMNAPARHINICGNSTPTTTNPGSYNLDTYWNATSTTVTVAYIAIGRWK